MCRKLILEPHGRAVAGMATPGKPDRFPSYPNLSQSSVLLHSASPKLHTEGSDHQRADLRVTFITIDCGAEVAGARLQLFGQSEKTFRVGSRYALV